MLGGLRQLALRALDTMSGMLATPPDGRTYHYDPTFSGMRSTLTTRINFTRINQILDAGKNGELAEAMLLYEEMEQRDARLRSVAGTRRRALTKLDYEIVSAAEMTKAKIDKTLADEVAAYTREKFDVIDGLGEALKHLATAIGPNLAVAEIEWNPLLFEPVAVFAIPSERLTMQLLESTDVQIKTREFPRGTPCRTPKFIVHIPESTSGSPLWKSLSEAQAWLWLIKKLAVADWGTFCELFGMPVRIGKYRPAATAEEKTALREMLTQMGSKAWAMVSESVDLEVVESSQRGVSPFEAILNFCDRQQGVLFLGGNLTSDTTGGTGTFAAAKVQDDVRDDLRDDDIACEQRTVRGQLIRPMVEFKYPGRNAPPPYFRRIKPETIDRLREGQVIKTAQGTGMRVPLEWAHKRLGIPKPTETDEVLEPVDAFVEGVKEVPDEDATE